MRTEEGKRIIKQALLEYVPPDWDVNVDRHCQHLQAYLLNVMDQHFKVAQGGPRATYISERVWSWRAAKLDLKRRAGHRRRMWSDAVEAAFFSWAGVKQQLEPMALAKHALLYQMSAAASSFATARIKKQIYQDKTDFLNKLAYDGLPDVGQILRRLKQNGLGGRKNRAKRSPLPKLCDVDGTVALNREHRDEIWLRFFGAQEYGQVMSVTDLLDIADKPVCVDEIQWALEDLPPQAEVAQVLREAPLGKSPGLDNLPGELLRAAPAEMANAAHSLILKSLVTLRQPVQWRGGVLFAAWKGSGCMDQPESHRSLFVSSALGKCYHKLMRNRGQRALQDILHGLHLGSKRGAPIGFASLYLLSCLRGAQARQLSFAALFIDTRAAYYRVVRQVATGALEKDEDVARLLASFGLQPEDMHQLLQVVKNGGLMGEAENRDSVRAACADFHRRTWFVTNYSDGRRLALTTTGSRPGESWADAIFAYVYARAMGTLVERADGESLLSYVPQQGTGGAFQSPSAEEATLARDGTWADDSVLPIEDSCPQRLVIKAKRLCSIAISTLEEFGLSPNLKMGKTRMIMALQGRGAQAARRAASVNGRAALYLADLQVEVPVVPHYIHLGAAIDAKLTLKCEGRRRLALLGAAYDQGKKLLFQNKTIPLKVRAKLFEVGARSTLFNLALWYPEGEAWKKLVGGFSRCLRKLLAPQIKGEQLFKLPLPLVHVLTDSWSLELVAVRSRLGLFAALVATGPDALWAVLQREGTWFGYVQADLQSLANFDDSWPKVTTATWPQWMEKIRSETGRFKAAVRRMLQARHSRDMARSRDLVALWAMLRMAGHGLPGEDSTMRPWSCRGCRKTFKSKGGLGAHLFKTHGRTAPYRACVSGTLCAACGRQYWGEGRLSIHLRDNPRCANYLRSHGFLAAHVCPGIGSKEWRRKTAEQFTLAPPETVQTSTWADSSSPWSPEATSAYREICCRLFDQNVWEEVQDVQGAILGVFERLPLYESEEIDVCHYIAAEIGDLRQQDPLLLWDVQSTLRVCEALETMPGRPDYGAIASSEDHKQTFEDFANHVSGFEWAEIIKESVRGCETREPASEFLSIGWEEGRPIYSDAGEIPSAAVVFVPVQLRTAWQQILQGQIKAVHAPASFWDHALSAPFRPLRALACN